MIASGPLPNRLLRMLDAADFDLLRVLISSGVNWSERLSWVKQAQRCDTSTFRTLEPYR
jgi:hypothetical protein